MDPVTTALCEERHDRIDERCSNHHNQIEGLYKKVDCILKNQGKFQWILIAALVALVIDIVRGFVVLDNVTKMVSK